MPKLLYLSLMRLPTEKAHGLQIMENCAAFADAGYDLSLWVARRWNTPALRAAGDGFAYYGLARNFRLRRIPCIDLFPLLPPDSRRRAQLAFYLLQLSYALVCCLLLLLERADVYYSRDELLVALLTRLKPGRKIAYEVHQFAPSRRGAALQRHCCRRAGSVIAITAGLRADLIAQRGAKPARVLGAHDGIRQARFAQLPPQAQARQSFGWNERAFIVGYVGRLQTLGMDKGLGTVIDALAQVDGAHLALVGGPDDLAQQLRQQWAALGLPAERFLYTGHLLPGRVPLALRAFDVCVLPFPRTAHFARYTSPLKLFEYMAVGGTILASALPAWADVLTDGETALLVPPGDSAAWQRAILHLREQPALRRQLGQRAREVALAQYTWAARAAAIRSHIESA